MYLYPIDAHDYCSYPDEELVIFVDHGRKIRLRTTKKARSDLTIYLEEEGQYWRIECVKDGISKYGVSIRVCPEFPDGE